MLVRSLLIFLLLLNLNVIAQEKEFLAEQWVWNPDNGNGTYTNPIINSDYSDPDVIRVDDKFK